MLNVIIIGAGKGGTSIFKTLLSVSDVNILGVFDPNFDAPGIKLARKNRINVHDKLEEINKYNVEKLLIEVTGNVTVKEKLTALSDDKTIIVDSSIALLISKIVNSRENIIKKLEEESGKLANLAMEIGATIQQTTATNEKNTSALNTKVSELISSSNANQTNIDETNNIIRFIKDVSEQTKLLGLNAAIEAARADLRGNGFNVVATEIRKLADETDQSVKRITHFIDELNSSIGQTLKDIKDMNNQVEEFTNSQDKVSTTLNNVADQLQIMANNLSHLSSV